MIKEWLVINHAAGITRIRKTEITLITLFKKDRLDTSGNILFQAPYLFVRLRDTNAADSYLQVEQTPELLAYLEK